jgi:hypothetical protein
MAAILRSIRRRLTVTNEIRELFNAHDQSVLLSPDMENEDDSGEKDIFYPSPLFLALLPDD